jgi:hypothetical protein
VYRFSVDNFFGDELLYSDKYQAKQYVIGEGVPFQRALLSTDCVRRVDW